MNYRILGNDCVCLPIEKIANTHAHAILTVHEILFLYMHIASGGTRAGDRRGEDLK